MNKFTFTYLIKQDKKTWDEFELSLFLLYKNLLSKLNCNYKLLIFCEGKPSKKASKMINFLKNKKINIVLKQISLKDYVSRKSSENYLIEFPHVSDFTKNFSLGYRDMCKFFTKDVFNDKNFNDSEYFVRVDSDSFFLDVKDRFIKSLEKINSDYAYIKGTKQFEDKGVSLGFGKCLYEFCIKNDIKKEYKSICQEATINPRIYYTNFEIINFKWIKSKIHLKLVDHIVDSKGIYNFRWGDALIRYYSVNLLKAKLYYLNY